MFLCSYKSDEVKWWKHLCIMGSPYVSSVCQLTNYLKWKWCFMIGQRKRFIFLFQVTIKEILQSVLDSEHRNKQANVILVNLFSYLFLWAFMCLHQLRQTHANNNWTLDAHSPLLLQNCNLSLLNVGTNTKQIMGTTFWSSKPLSGMMRCHLTTLLWVGVSLEITLRPCWFWRQEQRQLRRNIHS